MSGYEYRGETGNIKSIPGGVCKRKWCLLYMPEFYSNDWWMRKIHLSYEVAVIQRVKSCHTCKTRITAGYKTFEPQHDKTNKVAVHPAKTQISLGIRPVWSGSSLSAWRKLGSIATLWAQQRRLWSDWADAQADLSLRWVHSHFVGFVMLRLIWLHDAVCPWQQTMFSVETKSTFKTIESHLNSHM